MSRCPLFLELIRRFDLKRWPHTLARKNRVLSLTYKLHESYIKTLCLASPHATPTWNFFYRKEAITLLKGNIKLGPFRFLISVRYFTDAQVI